MSLILNWKFEEMKDDLHNGENEIFVVGQIGKVPMSFKISQTASESDIEKMRMQTRIKIKKQILKSLMKELGITSISIKNKGEFNDD